ncbi:MAG: hypothetical protein ACRCX8_05060 [Sarcina sp.]
MKREDLKNNVRIIGEIVTKDVRRNNVGTADETLSLELTIRTSEIEEHVVSFFAYKYGKNQEGKRDKSAAVSKLFTGYETVANEFKYIADENGDGTGEKVDIKGSLSKNMYVDKSDQLKELVKIKGTFCSRVKDASKYTPCAVWEAHMHITAMEEDKSDKTGNFVLVKGIVVDYVEDEFEFRIYSEKAKTGFVKIFDKGDSTRLEGRIVNRPDEAVEVDTEEDGWGDELEASASSNTIRRRYLEIVKGDTKTMDTDDEDHPLSEEKIKEYRKNMSNRKSDVIARSEEKKKEQNNAPKIDPNVGVEDLEEIIPF